MRVRVRARVRVRVRVRARGHLHAVEEELLGERGEHALCKLLAQVVDAVVRDRVDQAADALLDLKVRVRARVRVRVRARVGE